MSFLQTLDKIYDGVKLEYKTKHIKKLCGNPKDKTANFVVNIWNKFIDVFESLEIVKGDNVMNITSGSVVYLEVLVQCVGINIIAFVTTMVP